MEETGTDWDTTSSAQVEARPDNPPAFPENRWQRIGDVEESKCSPGMTLRDYFAAKAMQAVITNIVAAKNADGEYIRNVEDVAALAYRQADAMLKAKATASEGAV